jgi:hypothetical protein
MVLTISFTRGSAGAVYWKFRKPARWDLNYQCAPPQQEGEGEEEGWDLG